MDFDEESMGISAVPLRSAMLHANVTPFIMPPACSNCLTLVVKQFSKPLGILNMEATLKNPTSFTGYDVRAILRWQTAYIWLANPDDYTTLFDDGGTKTLNPFIAYATEKADRAFKAGASHTRPIQLRFSQAGHFSEITFVVDASWPTHCTEPYQISDQQVSGSLVGGLPVEVQCNVLDWQNDVTSVAVQPGDLSDVSMVLTHQTGTSWKGLITNKKGAAPGVYSLLLRAVSPGGSTDSLYDYLGVTVATTPVKGLDPGPWPMLGFDTRHTAQSPFYGPTASPALAWDSATQGTTWTAAYSGACLSASGRLYVAAGSGIYCLDLNGNYVWSKPPPFDSAYPPPQPLLTAGGAVVVCWSSLMSNSDPQGIYAYKQTNGDLLWSTKTIEFYPYGETKGFSVYDSPVVSSDDMLVAVAREHIVVALDASDGSQQWIWPNDTSKYQSILPGSYLDAWRCSPPMTSDGSFVVVAWSPAMTKSFSAASNSMAYRQKRRSRRAI
jgi:outer membrane protein assembly factor BamB